MANLSSPVQFHNSSPQHTYGQTRAEANIFDLDDPYLILKILGQQQQDPRFTAGSITCRFLALPTNEPYAFFHDIARYGHVIHEGRDKLIMKLPDYNLDLLNQIRQAWVSKYLTPFTECHITFDVPRHPRKSTLVIIQRVLPRVNKNGADALVGNGTADSDAVVSRERTVSLPAFYRENAAMPPHLAGRRRATSVPSPDVLAKMWDSYWHLPQLSRNEPNAMMNTGPIVD